MLNRTRYVYSFVRVQLAQNSCTLNGSGTADNVVSYISAS